MGNLMETGSKLIHRGDFMETMENEGLEPENHPPFETEDHLTSVWSEFSGGVDAMIHRWSNLESPEIPLKFDYWEKVFLLQKKIIIQ